MLTIEAKGRNGLPDRAQQETLFHEHQLLTYRKRRLISSFGGRRAVWHFGVFVLSWDGENVPEDGMVRWGRFGADGKIVFTEITINTLIGICGFNIHPSTLEPLTLRRHHKTSRLLEIQKTPLGFEVSQVVTRRS